MQSIHQPGLKIVTDHGRPTADPDILDVCGFDGLFEGIGRSVRGVMCF